MPTKLGAGRERRDDARPRSRRRVQQVGGLVAIDELRLPQRHPAGASFESDRTLARFDLARARWTAKPRTSGVSAAAPLGRWLRNWSTRRSLVLAGVLVGVALASARLGSPRGSTAAATPPGPNATAQAAVGDPVNAVPVVVPLAPLEVASDAASASSAAVIDPMQSRAARNPHVDDAPRTATASRAPSGSPGARTPARSAPARPRTGSVLELPIAPPED